MNLKIRLMQLGKTQAALIKALHMRNIKVTPAEMSNYLNGVANPPKSELVLAEAEKIIEEWEMKERR